jgi:hypothetical protein
MKTTNNGQVVGRRGSAWRSSAARTTGADNIIVTTRARRHHRLLSRSGLARRAVLRRAAAAIAAAGKAQACEGSRRGEKSCNYQTIHVSFLSWMSAGRRPQQPPARFMGLINLAPVRSSGQVRPKEVLSVMIDGRIAHSLAKTPLRTNRCSGAEGRKMAQE